jgi:hypothetical protein
MLMFVGVWFIDPSCTSICLSSAAQDCNDLQDDSFTAATLGCRFVCCFAEKLLVLEPLSLGEGKHFPFSQRKCIL